MKDNDKTIRDRLSHSLFAWCVCWCQRCWLPQPQDSTPYQGKQLIKMTDKCWRSDLVALRPVSLTSIMKSWSRSSAYNPGLIDPGTLSHVSEGDDPYCVERPNLDVFVRVCLCVYACVCKHSHLPAWPPVAPSAPALDRPWWCRWRWWHSWRSHRRCWPGWPQPLNKEKE